MYFDNVGGENLEAAIGALRTHGRVIACGAISRYNATSAEPGPRNIPMLVTKRLRMQGFIVSDHCERTGVPRRGRPPRRGRVDPHRETVVEGIERAPEAFIGLLTGENIGKMLVQVGPEP